MVSMTNKIVIFLAPKHHGFKVKIKCGVIVLILMGKVRVRLHSRHDEILVCVMCRTQNEQNLIV